MRKAIILIFFLFLGLLPGAYSLSEGRSCIELGNPSTDASDYHKSFRNQLDDTSRWTETESVAGNVDVSDTDANFTNGGGSWTDRLYTNASTVSTGTCSEVTIISRRSSLGPWEFSYRSSIDVAGAAGDVIKIEKANDNNLKMRIHDDQGSSVDVSVTMSAFSVVQDEPFTVALCVNDTGNFFYLWDKDGNKYAVNSTQTLGTKDWIRMHAEATNGNVDFRNESIYNETVGCPVTPEAAPAVPQIETYNLTSDGGLGCTTWSTDKSESCTTADTTPTVFVTTDINANCSIGRTDSNFTTLGISRRCAGGGDSSEHTCTLTPQDELTEETSSIYIGCMSSIGAENSSSSSGALKVSIHSSDLETVGRNAIETGIQHALASGYTIYTDQNLYARNSANNQFVTTFDKVVKKLNKIWAFNIITGNETFSDLFNITPIFHIMEMKNQTGTGINQTVYDLITETK